MLAYLLKIDMDHTEIQKQYDVMGDFKFMKYMKQEKQAEMRQYNMNDVVVLKELFF